MFGDGVYSYYSKCVCAYLPAHGYVGAHTCICTCVSLHMYVCTYVYLYAYVCSYACTSVHVYMCTCVYVCVHYMYMSIYVSVHICVCDRARQGKILHCY